MGLCRRGHPRTHYAAGAGELEQPGSATPRIAELAGVSRRTVNRWRHAGIPLELADRLACAIGLHPSNVWPEWYELEARDELESERHELEALEAAVDELERDLLHELDELDELERPA